MSIILGAYASAQFESVHGENEIPVGDNLGPFGPQRYFDGIRVRSQASHPGAKGGARVAVTVERRA